jgi:diguanylate cyclase (GGDEF)-like protein
MTTDDDALIFAEEEESPLISAHTLLAWKVMIVDDDPGMHAVTRLALRDFTHDGRGLSFLSAYSGREAFEQLCQHRDVALILLDVVMESDDAGLTLARKVRSELGNCDVRIILRTGQPGQAPERDVVRLYDINDYRSKDDLTAQRLWTSVLTALRAYQQIDALQAHRLGLVRILGIAPDLLKERSIGPFARRAVSGARALVGDDCVVRLFSQATGDGAEVAMPILLASDPPAMEDEGHDHLDFSMGAGFKRDERGMQIGFSASGFNLILDVAGPLSDGVTQAELTQVFMRMVAVGFDNLVLMQTLRDDRIHDRTTGLLNRAGLVGALEEAMAALQEGRIASCSVAQVDLRRFRDVNQEIGVAWGDALLRITAQRLRAALGAEGACARVGGDQFAVMLPHGLSLEEAKTKARDLVLAIAEPLLLEGREIHPFAMSGLSWCATPGERAEALLSGAERSLTQAKRNFGRLCEAVIGGQPHQGRLGLAVELNAALRQEQFDLHYQPIVAASSRAIVAFEALIRWQHPRRGLLAPGAFIPAAEEMGLIVPMGRWVLARAIRQTAQWNKCRPDRPMWISINVAAAQLVEPDFVKQAADLIAQNQLDPSWIKLEVTESALIEDQDMVAGILLSLREIGIRLCMDDFGTGYSNLAYLQTLPFDFLKIDRSFVASMSEKRESMTIVRTILALARQLSLQVVAEGVETAEQANRLAELGCDFLQGYYFGRPMQASQAEAAAGL